jgi:ribonuclease P protein subunit POP4
LTAFECRKLGLQKLPRNGLVYEDFKEMNQLWIGYMKELLPNLNDRKSTLDESLQMRICRADFHGAKVKVTRSNVASQVGIEGFVVMETKNTFQIISKDNKVKTISDL